MRIITILAASMLLAGCTLGLAEPGESRGAPRQVGTILDPFCAPDGSVVRVQYPNSQGNFVGAKASRENCPWNK